MENQIGVLPEKRYDFGCAEFEVISRGATRIEGEGQA